MDFSEKMMTEYQEEASRKLASVCRGVIALFFAMMLLGLYDVLVLPSIAYPVMLISCFILLLPTIFYNFCHFDSRFIRYTVLTLLVLMCGALYSILSYHVTIMLVLPVVIACLYRDKKCVSFTAIAGIPVMLITHLLAFYMDIYPVDSTQDLVSVLTRSFIPNVIEYMAVVMVALAITACFNDLVKKLVENNEQMFKDQESLISSLSTMVEMQSQETGQHVRRVSEYTQILCQALGLDKTDTWKIGMASMMHDVGKIAIPREILEKPGKLTDEEFFVIKRHIFYGKEILEQYPGEIMQLSAVIAYQHHEHFDGTGYMGLSGHEISREAQCVALADFFDALVSKRSYKDAWTPEQARREILAQKGKYFDPYLVNLFDIHFVDFLEVYRKYPD